jgi:prolipoprotein diacylglyceryltransferase
MKNNAIWELKDAETYYELSFVIYALFFLAASFFRFTQECFSKQSFQSTATIKNIFLSLFLIARSESYKKRKHFASEILVE